MSEILRRAMCLAAVASTVAVAPLALAADPGPDIVPMHVMTVQSTEAEDQAEALTKALRNAVRASRGWSLAPGDFSLEVLSVNLKCPDPPDAPCQARIADHMKSDRYIWGTLKKKGNNVAGEVALWVRGKGTTRVPVEYSVNLTEANEDALKTIATQALKDLAGLGPKGGVHISAGGIVGQLFIDGEPMGSLANGEITIQIPSGPHTIVVKSPGYANAEAGVTVRPNMTVDVPLKMSQEAPSSGVNGRAVAGWSLVGGGVALAGAGALMGVLQLSNKKATQGGDAEITAKFQEYVDKDHKNACDQAALDAGKDKVASRLNDVCGKDKLFTVLQFVFYPAAVVAGGAGVYFLVTSSPKKAAPKTGWNVNPTFGPTGGKLDLTYKF